MKSTRISMTITFGILLIMLVAATFFTINVASAQVPQGGGTLPTPTTVSNDPTPSPLPTDIGPTPVPTDGGPTPVPTDVGPTPEPTATAIGPKSEHFSYRGETAYARFETYDPTTCIVTMVTVLGTDNRIKQDGAPSVNRGAFIAIYRYNECTWEVLMDAYGYGPVSQDEYTINKQLDTATLNTTLFVRDFISGDAHDVQIDLTWTGYGDIDRTHTSDHFEGPGYKFTLNMDARFRLATASGTIIDGTETYASGESIYGDLASVKQGSIYMQTNQ